MKVSFIFMVFFLAVVCVFSSTASEVEQEELVRRVVRADKPPRLPHPTPPRPILARPRRDTCTRSTCRTYCKSRHPAYSGLCVNGKCDCS